MKIFWNDYMDLQRHSNAWFKKHWFGYILLTIVIYLLTVFIWLSVATFDWGEIVLAIKSKFKRQKKDVEEEEA